MEANGFKQRLKEAKENSEYIKIIFQYPSSERAIIKRGYVEEVFDDSFEFDEKLDGFVTYSFKFIVEIKHEEKENGNS